MSDFLGGVVCTLIAVACALAIWLTIRFTVLEDDYRNIDQKIVIETRFSNDASKMSTISNSVDVLVSNGCAIEEIDTDFHKSGKFVRVVGKRKATSNEDKN